MIVRKTIRIENVYYMLAYAFTALRKGPYAKIEPDAFVNAEDLFGWIVGQGMAQLIKRGLHREYVGVTEDIPVLRGKIDLRGTIAHRVARRHLLSVEHDEFSEDNLINQILKTTAVSLVRTNRLKVSGNLVRRSLLRFGNVRTVAPRDIRWERLRYQRSNQQYLMLMNICRFVLDHMMMSETDGNARVPSLDFSDAKMHELFEAFVRAYFARHFNLRTGVRKIQWDLAEDSDLAYLPNMQADVILERDGRALIIDTKFYGEILAGRSGEKIRSGHLYQLLSYVTNYQAAHRGESVSGMLLYAKTTADDLDKTEWTIGGHKIGVRTLDLDQKFSLIAATLDEIVHEQFGVIRKVG